MKKKLGFILVLISLIALSTICVQQIRAQNSNNITINSDGSVTPSSAPIVQNGGTYALTNDIRGTIVITKSNITFNGNEHIIDQQASTQNSANAFGIFLSNVYNVTVANTKITNTGNGIYAIENPTAGICVENGGSNTIIRNDFANNYNAMSFLETNDNLIIENNITNNHNPYVIVSAVMFWGSSYNTIYHNNFIDNTSPAGLASFNSQSQGNKWDNGAEGNFWDDYNGTDADGDGIGDTPYVIDENNIDHYPLMNQADIVSPVPTPSPTATSTLSPTPISTVPEFSWLMILPLFAIMLFAAMKFKNRSRNLDWD